VGNVRFEWRSGLQARLWTSYVNFHHHAHHLHDHDHHRYRPIRNCLVPSMTFRYPSLYLPFFLQCLRPAFLMSSFTKIKLVLGVLILFFFFLVIIRNSLWYFIIACRCKLSLVFFITTVVTLLLYRSQNYIIKRFCFTCYLNRSPIFATAHLFQMNFTVIHFIKREICINSALINVFEVWLLFSFLV
jgi:hypothetical protein